MTSSPPPQDQAAAWARLRELVGQDAASSEVGQVWWLSRALVGELMWVHFESKARPFLAVAVAPAGNRGGSTYLVEGRTRDPRVANRRRIDDRCLIEVAPSEAGTPRRTYFLLSGGRLRVVGNRRLLEERVRSRAQLVGCLPADRLPEVRRMVAHGPYPILRRIWELDARSGRYPA